MWSLYFSDGNFTSASGIMAEICFTFEMRFPSMRQFFFILKKALIGGFAFIQPVTVSFFEGNYSNCLTT